MRVRHSNTGRDSDSGVGTPEVEKADDGHNIFASGSGENLRIDPAPRFAPVNFVIVEDAELEASRPKLNRTDKQVETNTLAVTREVTREAPQVRTLPLAVVLTLAASALFVGWYLF